MDDVDHGLELQGTEEDPGGESDLQCGWLGVRPAWMQRANRSCCFLACICVLVIAQGMIVTGISGTIITSLERRFGFKSAQVAMLGSSYDTAYGLFAAVIGFVGAVHKPRYLGLGAILMAVASFAATLPHYLVGQYTAGLAKTTDFCLQTVVNSSAPPGQFAAAECDTSKTLYLVVFCAAYALLGAGAVPLYTLGTAHLDHITDRGQNGLYLGIMYACAAIGPAIGFGLGKPMLNAFVDINQPADSQLTPNDPNWVGAWWMGYLVGCALFCIIIPPLLALPKEFPDTKAIMMRKQRLHDTVKETGSLSVPTLRTIWPSTKALLTNRCYMGLTASTTCEGFAVGGLSTFSAKFIESQFGKTASTAALLTGAVVVVGATLGIFLGGFLIKYFKWDCRQTIRGATVIAFVAALFTTTFLIGCPGQNIAGIGSAYANGSARGSLDDTCHGWCNCSTDFFKPLCVLDTSVTYFSPCHAGCTKVNQVGAEYLNCSCFPPGTSKVIDGICPPADCELLVPFLLCELLLMFSTFLNNVPIINATLRVVPESQGSYAMGLQQVFIRFLAFVPAPIILGRLFDDACILWQTDSCQSGENINCLVYDNARVRRSVFLLAGLAKLLSFAFLLLVLRSYSVSGATDHCVLIPNDNPTELTSLPSEDENTGGAPPQMHS